MNNKKTFGIATGLAFGAGIGYLFYKSSKKPSSKSNGTEKKIEREVIVNVLKDFQKEFFGCFCNISMISNQIKQQSQNRISESEIKEMLLNQRIS